MVISKLPGRQFLLAVLFFYLGALHEKNFYMFFCLLILIGCDGNTIEGIHFSSQEIQRWEEIGLPIKEVKNQIQGMKKSGWNEKQIRDHIYSIKSWGFDPVEYLSNMIQEDKNRIFSNCLKQYEKNIQNINDKERVVQFCSCVADFILDNTKAINGLPITLSENDEKDTSRVEMAWIELEKKMMKECKNKMGI